MNKFLPSVKTVTSVFAMILAFAFGQKAFTQTIVPFSYTGAVQSWTVPSGVISITISMWGAGGGAGGNASGGSGAFVQGTLAVSVGQVYTIVVGGPGNYTAGATYGGGGASGANGGSGGGYSGIFSSTTLSQANAIAIAGAGAGGGNFAASQYGGAGGATTGSAGGNLSAVYTGGSGGSLTAGGAGGLFNSATTRSNPGLALTGGSANTSYSEYGGGGGGGYYGGGSGYSSSSGTAYNSGGGGGASYLSSSLTAQTNIVGTTDNTGTTAPQAPGSGTSGYVAGDGNGAVGTGTIGGNGLVLITYTVPCTAPTAQPTALVLTPASTTSISGSFAAASPAPTGYLVVASTSSTLSANPVNGTTYTTGTALGGGTVVQQGTGTTFTASGLTANTKYYFFIFSYNNGSCSGGPVYFTTSPPLSGNGYPACATPTAPTALTFPSNTTTSIGGSFTAAAGVSGYLVVVSTSSTLSSGPVNGTTYTAGGSLGGGTVVQVGTGTTFSYTASANTLYYFFVYSYNSGASCGTVYSTPALTGNSYTTCSPPTAQPTALVLTPASTTSISGSFAAASPVPTGYLVVASTSSTLSANPVNGTTYTTGTALGGGTVVQEGITTTFTATGLTANTQYYFFIFSYNNTTCSGGPLFLTTTSPLSGNGYPACATPTAPTALTFPSNTSTSIGGSFAAASGVSGYLVVVSTSSTLSSGPVNGTTYTAGGSLGGGTVVQVGTGTTFTYSPATANTLYYFFVYSYNSGASCGTSYSSQLTGSSYTACAPPGVATTLVLTPAASSVTGTFATPSGGATNYLVIRTTTSTVPTAPTSGTTYVAGAAYGSTGTVVSVATTTGFTDNGLTPSTQYWYWIYSYNTTTCTGGPLYSTMSLNGTTTTTATTPLYWAGRYSVLAQTTSLAWNTATNWSTSPTTYTASATAPSAANAVYIPLSSGSGTNRTMTFNANVTIASLTVTASLTGGAAFFIDPSTYTFTINGNLSMSTATGTGAVILCSSGSSGTITINGTSTIGASGDAGYSLIGNDGTESTASPFVFGGNVTFNANGYVNYQNYTNATFNSSSAQTLSNNDANAANVAFDNMTVSSNLTLTGTAADYVYVYGGNLTISANSSLTLPSGYALNQYEASTGTFTLGSGATLTVNGATTTATNEVTGSNFPGGFATYTLNAASTVVYTGTVAQIVYATTYGNLTIANGSGGACATNAATTVAGTLTLTSGILTTTTANTLTVTNTAPTAVSPGSISSFVSGPLNWKLPAGLTTSSNVYNFPVGSGGIFLPYSVTSLTTGATTGPTLQIQGVSTPSGSGATADGTTLSAVSTTEYWSSVLISGTYSNASISLTRQTALGSLNAIAQSTATPETVTGAHKSLGGTVSGSYSVNNSSNTGGTTPQYYCFGQLAGSSLTISNNGTQIGTQSIGINTSNDVISIGEIVEGYATSTLNSVSFVTSTSSTYASSDIGSNGFALLYNTTNSIGTATQLGTGVGSVSGPGETIAFNSLSKTLPVGTYYFWLTVNITAGAVSGHTIIVNGLTSSSVTATAMYISGSTSTAGPSTILVSCASPGTPTSLGSISSTTTTISATIGAPSIAPTGYVVFFSTSATPPAPVNGTTYTQGTTYFTNYIAGYVGSSTSFTSSALSSNTNYYAYVFAYNNTSCAGGPLYSSAQPISVSEYTCIVAPTGLTSSNVTSTSATVSWTASSGTITSYTLYVNAGSAGPPWANTYTITSGTSYNLTGLSVNTTYYYEVIANNTANTSTCGSSSAASSANFSTIDGTVPTDYFESNVTGNWSAIGTWKSSHPPGNGPWINATLVPTYQAAQILITNINAANNAAVVVTVDVPSTGSNLVVSSTYGSVANYTASLAVNANLSLTNNLTIYGPSTSETGVNVDSVHVSSGIYLNIAGNLVFDGTYVASGSYRSARLNIVSGGVVNVGGDVDESGVTGGDQIYFTGTGTAGQLNLHGNWNFPQGGSLGQGNPVLSGTGTVAFSGTTLEAINQYAGSVITFYNLVDSNISAPLYVDGSVGISNSLTMALSNTVLIPVPTVVFNSAGAAGTISGIGTIHVNRITGTPDYVDQYKFTTNTLSSMTVDYAGANNQNVNSTTTIGSAYGSIILDSGGTKTLQGLLGANSTTNGVNNDLRIRSTSVFSNTGNYNITIGGNWVDSTGSSAGNYTPGTSTVYFNKGASAQSIYGTATGQTFNNIATVAANTALSVGGSTATLTLNGSMTMANSTTMSAGTATNIYVASSWTDNNTGSATGGFMPGTNNTVTFDGGTAQSLTGTSLGETFYNLSTATSSTAVTGVGSIASLFVNNNVSIASSTTLSVGTALKVYCGGNWTNSGTFTSLTGKVTFDAATAITQNLNPGASSFYNLVVNSAGTVLLYSNPLITTDTFYNIAGTFNANSLAHTVTNQAIISGGSYLASTATQTFNGKGLQINGGLFTGSTGNVATTNDTLSSGTLTAPSGLFSVTGNWVQSGGTFTPGSNTVTFTLASGTQLISTGSGGTAVANSAFNNVNHTGAGLLQILSGSAPVTTGGTFTNASTAGNFDANGQAHTVGLQGIITGNSYLAKTGTQTFNGSGLKINGGTFTGSTGNVVTTNDTLSSGTLTAPTGTFSVSGNWAYNGGTFTPGALTNAVTFNGSGTQVIGGSLTTAFNGLTINNTGSGVTLIDANNTGISKTVNGLLTLSNGLLTSDAADLLLLTSTATTNMSAPTVTGTYYSTTTSYVNGPIQRTGSTAFFYPVGQAGIGYVPAAISATTPASTQTFTVQYIHQSSYNFGPVVASNPQLTQVSGCDYWRLDLGTTYPATTNSSLPTGTTANITLYWNPNNPQQCPTVPTANYVTNLTQLVIGHLNFVTGEPYSGLWVPTLPPQSAYSFADNSSGTMLTSNSISAAGVTTFSPFTLASTNTLSNPLLLTLNYFNAVKENGYNNLSWKAECTSPSATFVLERSSDGLNFSTIDSINVSTAADCSSPLAYNDYTSSGPKVYYRLKVTDINGNVTYSEIRLILNSGNVIQLLGIRPNPVQSQAWLTISSSQSDRVELVMYSVDGKEIQRKTVQVPAGSTDISLETGFLAQGMYIIRGVFSTGQSNTIPFIKQ